MQAVLDQALAAGKTNAEALLAVQHFLLSGGIPGVDTATVELSGRAVYYTTVDGLRFVTLSPLADEKSGGRGGSSSARAVATQLLQRQQQQRCLMSSASTGTGCGRVLGLSPYWSQFGDFGDESNDIIAILHDAGACVRQHA